MMRVLQGFKKLGIAVAVIGMLCCSVLCEDVCAMDTAMVGEELSPEKIAQQKAIEDAQRKRMEAEAEVARTAAALEEAQRKAQAQEAADTYAKWGTYGDYASPEMILAQGASTVQTNAQTNTVFGDSTAMPIGTAVEPPTGIMTVDLVIFAGQSNMSGAGGDATKAPAVANGQGYEFKAISNPNGLYPIKEPFGSTEAGYIGENASLKKGTLVSSFVSNYYARTGVPVVAITASRGNTNSNWWAQPQVISDLTSRFTKAKNYLNTNHYSVRKAYLVFLQGESDVLSGIKPAQYKANINAAFSGLFNAGLNQVFIITPGHNAGNTLDFSSIINTQKEMCASDSRYSLGSDMLVNLPASYMTDELHYNQKALNMVGADAAARAAAYTNATCR